ncbi:GNAT family N-acetyltransferase [Cytobacillus gottheilii]|uniref:GNAT family N-acetyltransferase n=1 Tax=Cytobacillus gottheilii TaxID=859144 RepID=UPI0009BC5CC1|nr:GNAT family N-acetyltransferase [Cytobacillus gottheilii]
MKIRKAVIEDAPKIAQIHVDSWRETYKGIVADSYLEDLSYENREKMWNSIIPHATVYVAENELQEVVGFANCGKERSGDYQGYTGEIYTLYLLKKEHGKGLGKALFQHCREEMIDKGMNSFMLFVLADNPTRTFYEKLGGKELERLNIEMGGEQLEEIAYGFSTI